MARQVGKGIFLGRPIGTPTGICIGRPGLMIFRGSDSDSAGLDMEMDGLEIEMDGLEIHQD